MSAPFDLRGSIVPLISPLTASERIDTDALPGLFALHEKRGTDAIFLLGTCGEGPYLTDPAKEELLAAALECGTGLPILVGVAETATLRAVQWAAKATRPGVAALVVVLPTFHRIATAGEAVAHFLAIREAAAGPIILYNLPKKTGGAAVPIEAIRTLLEHKAVIGIKDSAGDLDYLADLIRLRDDFPDFRVMNGELRCAAKALEMGVDGLVMSYTNVEPEKCREMIAAGRAGDVDKARALQRRFVSAWDEFPNSAAPTARAKSILSARGLCRPICCAPTDPVDPIIPETMKEAQA